MPQLFGEQGFTSTERRTARPTMEINGLTSGYQGEGSKTIIPAWARAKLTFRLVPNQSPAKIVKCMRRQLQKLCPPTVRMEIARRATARSRIWFRRRPAGAGGIAGVEAGVWQEPVLLREGGSIPIVNDFKKVLGVDTLLLGLALPDDNAHSPNEKFNLGNFAKGQEMSAHLWQELSSI